MGSGDESNESTSEHVQVRRFNESFYSSDPADYLQTRLYLLILAGGKRSELRRLIEEGVEYAGLTVGAKPEDDASDNEGSAGGDREDRQNTDERDWDRFLVVESQQLLHHACETALRMFFVHAAASKVPWVELAAERSFSRFKDRVRAEFIDKEPDPELVAHVVWDVGTRPMTQRWKHGLERWKVSPLFYASSLGASLKMPTSTTGSSTALV